MNHDTKRQRWAVYVSSLEKRLAAAKKIQEVLDEYPELADDLIKSFVERLEPTPEVQANNASSSPASSAQVPVEAVSTGTPPPVTTNPDNHRTPDGKTLRQRVCDLFIKSGNTPISGPKIAEVLEVGRGQVSNLFYSSSDQFESFPDPSGGRKVLWRLRQWPPQAPTTEKEGVGERD